MFFPLLKIIDHSVFIWESLRPPTRTKFWKNYRMKFSLTFLTSMSKTHF